MFKAYMYLELWVVIRNYSKVGAFHFLSMLDENGFATYSTMPLI